ncbi:MAG: carbohydrate ABC transporter permease [Clostridia bacterium]|nr:carbohydrate ABC transporter permease [Clostridia bacterium]
MKYKEKKTAATKPKAGVFFTVVGVLIWICVFALLAVIGWGFLKSLQSYEDFLMSGSVEASIPTRFSNMTLANYVSAFTDIKAPANGRDAFFPEMLANSVIYAVGCAAVHTLVPSVVAYLTAKYKVWFNKVIMFIIYFTMVFQVYGSMPAMIMMMNKLNLMNTWWGLFIQKSSFIGGGYLFYFATFHGISKEYSEAAVIDGASHWQVMLKVMFPLARVIILVQFVSSFITYWNDYQTALVYNPNNPTAAYGLFSFIQATNSYDDFISFKVAGTFVILVPIFALFMIMRKYLLGDMTAGGVKG